MVKANTTVSDPGIKARTFCSVVALATARPTKQSLVKEKINIVTYLNSMLLEADGETSS